MNTSTADNNSNVPVAAKGLSYQLGLRGHSKPTTCLNVTLYAAFVLVMLDLVAHRFLGVSYHDMQLIARVIADTAFATFTACYTAEAYRSFKNGKDVLGFVMLAGALLFEFAFIWTV